MDYTKFSDDIYKCINMKNKYNTNNQINDMIKDSILINYSDEMNNIILSDITLTKNIMEFIKSKIEIYAKKSISYNETLNKLRNKIINLNTYKKKSFDKIFDTLYNYFLDNKVLESLHDNYYIKIDEITVDDILNCQNNNNQLQFNNWRENQQFVIDDLNTNGLKTGIHCQATGTGKTLEILYTIGFTNQQIKNPKIILFTERVDILSDLFLVKNKKIEIDKDKIKFWKDNNITDLTKFHIIERVINKDKNWIKEFNESKKPTLLIVNRLFLTMSKKYEQINNLNLILHDECHNTGSSECYNFLKYFKNKNVITIGYSATPLRAANKNDIDNTIKIYGINGKLNIISNYNIIFSIEKDLILPPVFHWYNINENQKKKSKNLNNANEILQEEYGAVFKILDEILPILPNKKIVAWCGTKELCKDWKNIFIKHKGMFQEVNKLKIYCDYNYNNNNNHTQTNDYESFKNETNNCIMLCCQRYREGSDIHYLDCVLFLDKVKKRGAIPFIQSIGRVLRKGFGKISGHIIEGVIKTNDNYEKEFIDKIIGYYMMLTNYTFNEDTNKYEQYVKLLDIIKFDKKNKIINLTLLNNVVIPINCKTLDWENIVSKFQSILQNTIKLKDDEVFKIIIDKIKKLEPFKNSNNNFWEEYTKLDHNKLNIPKDIYTEYKQFFDQKTWYQLLGFDKYLNFARFKKFCNQNYIDSHKKLYRFLKNNNNYPFYPEEYYRLTGWNSWNFKVNKDYIL
jgi:superfamily II DNA or RNA helicase